MISDVTLIIPSQNAEKNLLNLLSRIPEWYVIPNEIIIVDSSEKSLNIPNDFYSFTEQNNIKMLIIRGVGLYPGHARNIGIKHSNNNLLAFLDTSTIPDKAWLSSGLEIIKEHNFEGVWGKTYYTADNILSKIYKASTYGNKPINTFPGSILKKNVFNMCGLFVEYTRAGEDGDWISRAKLHNLQISNPTEFLTYRDLNGARLRQIVSKWYRNYVHSSQLPYSRAHRDFYFYGLSFLAIMIAFNWNAVLASWDTENAAYIPNITKICVSILITLFVIFRGIILPYKKGTTIKFIFPINFLFITLFSAVLDLTKIIAFLVSRFTKH